MKNICIFFLIFSFIFSSCSSNKKYLKTDLKKSEGLYFGKIRPVVNGEDVSESCTVTIGNNRGWRKVDLDKNLLIVGKAPRSKVFLKKITCKLGASVYNHLFKGAYFKNAGRGVNTYFGNVRITWEMQRRFKLTALLFWLGNLILAARDKSEGKLIRFGVVERTTRTIVEFKSEQKAFSKRKYYRSLMKEGKTLN